MTLLKEIRKDFSLRYGSIGRAMLSFVITLAAFVIIPYAVFSIVAEQVTGAGLEEIIDKAWELIINMIKYSAPLVIISIPAGFYRAGSFARVPFKVLYALYFASWLWMASNGGIFSMPISDVGGADAVIELNLRPIVYVMIMIAFVKVFIAFSECGGSRKKYLKEIDKKKDTMAKRKARRVSD